MHTVLLEKNLANKRTRLKYHNFSQIASAKNISTPFIAIIFINRSLELLRLGIELHFATILREIHL